MKRDREATDPQVNNNGSDVAELRALMADFTPEQRAAVLGAAAQAATDARARVLADRMLADCPPAPPCTPWCTASHDQPKGWGEVERHGETQPPVSVEKTCSAKVGLAQVDDGAIMVSLERLAASDCLAGRWEPVFVGDSFVSLHPDNEFSLLTIEHLNALQQLLHTARELVVGTER